MFEALLPLQCLKINVKISALIFTFNFYKSALEGIQFDDYFEIVSHVPAAKRCSFKLD